MSDNHDLLNDNDMYSFSGYEVDDVCSNSDNDACGDSVPFKPHKISVFKVLWCRKYRIATHLPL